MLSLFAAGPVAADHDSEQTLLTATLTVDADSAGDYLGCDDTVAGLANCSAALTNTSFTHENAANTVAGLAYETFSDSLRLRLGTSITKRSWMRLTLYVDGKPFRADEVVSARTTNLPWPGPGLSWTDGQKVQIRLTAKPWTGVVLESDSFVPGSEGYYDLIVPEGGSDTFKVKLSRPPTANVTVDLSFLGGGGGIHWNWNAVTVNPKQLTFTSSNWSQAQTVTVTGVVDGDSNHEHIIVAAVVSSTDLDYASPDGSEGVFVTVTDDGGAVQVGAYPATVREGATASVTVWLSRASTGFVTVDYATENGTATAGSDYTAVSGTLTFLSGATRQTVQIPTLDDSIEDSGETFRLALSNLVGASLAPHYTRAPVTIRNDEALLDGLSAEVAGSAGGPWTALGIGAFSSQTTAYAATVPQGTTHARLVPTTADEDLTLTAGRRGSALTRLRSGEAGPAVALAAGDNVLVVKASAAEDVETTYAVTVNRGGASTGGGGSDPGGGDSGGGDSGGGDSGDGGSGDGGSGDGGSGDDNGSDEGDGNAAPGEHCPRPEESAYSASISNGCDEFDDGYCHRRLGEDFLRRNASSTVVLLESDADFDLCIYDRDRSREWPTPAYGAREADCVNYSLDSHGLEAQLTGKPEDHPAEIAELPDIARMDYCVVPFGDAVGRWDVRFHRPGTLYGTVVPGSRKCPRWYHDNGATCGGSWGSVANLTVTLENCRGAWIDGGGSCDEPFVVRPEEGADVADDGGEKCVVVNEDSTRRDVDGASRPTLELAYCFFGDGTRRLGTHPD